MLVLSRNTGEKINIWNGDVLLITITVIETREDKVWVGVDAPKDLRILREEHGDPDGRDYA